jgi:hypothetical protein
LWGHRHPFSSGLHAFTTGPFPGMEPAGDYPIHIIVKSGRITLLGVVDNETDKNVAGIKAGPTFLSPLVAISSMPSRPERPSLQRFGANAREDQTGPVASARDRHHALCSRVRRSRVARFR